MLTQKELKKLNGQFSEIINNNKYSKNTIYGEHMILVGEKYSDVDNLVLIKGTTSNSKITKVISIVDGIQNEYKAYYLKELVYGTYDDYLSTWELIETIAGEKVFSAKSYEDFDSYFEIKKQGKISTNSNTDSRTIQNGAGSIQSNKTNDTADELTSAFSMPESKKSSVFDAEYPELAKKI